MDLFKKKEEQKEITLMDKLADQARTLNLFDFNPEFLNKYFIECINSYLSARYYLDFSKASSHLSDNCKIQLKDDIEKCKLYSKNINVIINIKSVDIIKQDVQNINYISDLLMLLKVHIFYERQNIYTQFITPVIEKFSQKIWFHNNNDGWVLEKYFPREPLK